jgi:phage tail-like protein
VKSADKKQYQRLLTITLKNESGEDAVVWKATNAWPLKVQSTELKADGNEIAIETIEIAHEGLTIEFK